MRPEIRVDVPGFSVRGKNIKVVDVGEEVRRRLTAGDTSLGVNVGPVAIPY
jgi:hypothetical protein